MSDHSHYRTYRESRAAFPGLLVAFFLEVPGFVFGHQLAITAHIFDIFSDMVAFGIVILGAWVSGRLDDRGRDHHDGQAHPEQLVVAYTSLVILLLGAVLVMASATTSFGQETETVTWQDWWLIPGPVVSLLVYGWLRDKVKKIQAKDITTVGLEQHVRGDVRIAAFVIFLTMLNMAFETSWINPTGGIIMSLILLNLGLDYFGQIRETVKKNF